MDDALRNTLLLQHVGWLRGMAQRQHARLAHQIPEDDLAQVGWIAMADAARTYDPDRGVKFETYAYMRVVGGMKDHARGLDPVPRLERQRQKHTGPSPSVSSSY